MKANRLFNLLRRHKYRYAFVLPYLLSFLVCGIVLVVSACLGKSNHAVGLSIPELIFHWGNLSLFYGVIAGLLGLLILAIVQKMQSVKSNMFLTSIAVVVFVFLLGSYFWYLPEQQRKYLMPNHYSTYLKSRSYTVWYYPMWKDPNANHFKGNEYAQEPPAVSLTSSKGESIRFVSYNPGNCCLLGRHLAVRIGEFEVQKPGIYQLTASREETTDFVIALVPAYKETLDGRCTLPFDGFFDEHLESK